jgi:murein L,D-transpeptidase YafK
VLACCACRSHEPVAPPPPAARVAASVPAIPQQGVALVVEKSRRVLTVYDDGVPVFEYPVVMGRNGNGPKRFEGDMRTPEGTYRVTDKRPHERWRYFIELDYPNDSDVSRYAAAVTDGDVPVVRGEFMGIGAQIGIHGSDRPLEQEAGLDWTRGCVAMRSDDVAHLYPLVVPGTPVLILP